MSRDRIGVYILNQAARILLTRRYRRQLRRVILDAFTAKGIRPRGRAPYPSDVYLSSYASRSHYDEN